MSYKRISPIPVAEGGTGASASLTGILTGNGASAMTASTVTQYGTVVAGASNAVSSVAPSATSGVPLISQGAAANPAYGTAVVEGGGTGGVSYTAYSVICAGTTATGAFQNVSGLGSSGQVLVSQGAASLPAWAGAGTVSLGTTDHAVQVGNASGTLTSLGVGTTGQVLIGSTGADPAFGALGVNSGLTNHGLLVGQNNSAIAAMSAGTAGQIVTSSGAAADPVWTTNTYPATSTQGDIVYASANNTLTTLAKNTSATRYLSNTGASNAPAWAQVDSSNGITNMYVDADDVWIGASAGNTGNPGFNVFVGTSAGNACSTGQGNTAIGYQAYDVGNQNNNTMIGNSAGGALTSGANNTALGQGSLQTTTTGSRNIALGSVITGTDYPGKSWGTGDSDNIAIANKGVSGDSGIMRIGTSGTHVKAFISGIRGVTTDAADAVAVLISSTGQLGTVSSSIRYKMNVQDMFDESNRIHSLRPVTFEYKQHQGKKAYGLIAEEVKEKFPDLVAYNQEGEPESVKYHDLPVLLLNEIQKLKRQVDFLTSQILDKDR